MVPKFPAKVWNNGSKVPHGGMDQWFQSPPWRYGTTVPKSPVEVWNNGSKVPRGGMEQPFQSPRWSYGTMVPKSARRNCMVTSRLVKQGLNCVAHLRNLHITMLQCLEPVSNNIYMVCQYVVAALTKHVTCRRGGAMHVYILALPIEMYSCVA